MRRASLVRQRECFSAEIRIDYGRYRKRMTHSFKIPLMKSTLIYHNLMPNVFCVRFHNLLGLGWQILRHIMMMSPFMVAEISSRLTIRKHFSFFSCIGGELLRCFQRIWIQHGSVKATAVSSGVYNFRKKNSFFIKNLNLKNAIRRRRSDEIVVIGKTFTTWLAEFLHNPNKTNKIIFK